MSNTSNPLTPQQLCEKIYFGYNGRVAAYVVGFHGGEVLYHSKSKRDAALFAAELMASIKLRGSRLDPQVQEVQPAKPEPKQKPVVLKPDEMVDKVYSVEEFLPPFCTRVLVSTARHTAIARRVPDEGRWCWKFDAGSRLSASEVFYWKPIQLNPTKT